MAYCAQCIHIELARFVPLLGLARERDVYRLSGCEANH